MAALLLALAGCAGAPVAALAQDGILADKIAVFRQYTALQVIVAGLLDGINPCAMTVAVFLVSFLLHAGRARREVLIAGLCYAGAVFLAYFAIMLGLFETLLALSWTRAVNIALSWCAAALAGAIGVLTLIDARAVWRGSPARDTLVRLPLAFQQRIHALVRARLGAARLAGGAFLLGFAVSLFEFVCSGQAVFPTLALILKEPALPDALLRWRAAGYLALYNLAFIAPLLAVFLAAWTGVTSQRLAGWAQRHFLTAKLLVGALFLWFAVLLVLLSLKDLHVWW